MRKLLATISTDSPTTSATDPLEDLRGQLERYPADGYPVQHATASFHLGSALLHEGDTDTAQTLLRTAVQLYAGALPLEHAKALNMLGVALRQAGEPAPAVAAFTEAADTFAARKDVAEEGAARFNSGLAWLDQDDLAAAAASFEAAIQLFDPATTPGPAGAVRRELGTVRLVEGDLGRATDLLREAVTLSDSARDTTGYGAAANGLGLALLGSGDAAGAIEAFRAAAGSHPRSVRPLEFALVRANLALALEQHGNASEARVTARHTLSVEGVDPNVAEHAAGVLDRLGPPLAADLASVLQLRTAHAENVTQTETALAELFREELTCLAALPAHLHAVDVGEWMQALLADEDLAADRVAAWLGAVLELPPAATQAIVTAMVDAASTAPPERAAELHALVWRGLARFHPPQAARVEELVRAAARSADFAAWG